MALMVKVAHTNGRGSACPAGPFRRLIATHAMQQPNPIADPRIA
jgi:hypothetical protein